jgi:hypothetical protein
MQRQTSGFTAKRAATFEADLDILLGDLCRQWGFCNRLSGRDLVERERSLSADEFATAMLSAEGFEPELETQWRRNFKRVFIERYGTSVVSADGYLGA